MQQDAEFTVQYLFRKKIVSLSTLKIFSMYLYIFRDYRSIIFFPTTSIRASVRLV